MRATATWPSFFGGGDVTATATGKYAGTGLGVELGPKRFGVRPEVRYMREFVKDGRDGNAITAMCGFYYRF